MTEYTLSALKEQMSLLPNLSLRFGDGETGWGKYLGNGRALVTNVPLEPRLHVMDVVEYEQDDRGGNTCGAVLWRGYANKTGLHYPEPNVEPAATERWQKICSALDDAGLMAESFTPGWAGVCHHADTDILAILAAAGVDTSGFTLRTDWDDT